MALSTKVSLADGEYCSFASKSGGVGERVADQEFVHIADVPVEEIWARPTADPKAVPIYVRTKAEWAFGGLPDLSFTRAAGGDGGMADLIQTAGWMTISPAG